MYNNFNLEAKRGDIWFIDLGSDGKGSEQKGARPVIVIQNDIGNKFSPTTIIATITSQITKAKLPTHVEIEGYGLNEKSVILLEQIRTIDKGERLKEYIGHVGEDLMQKVDNATMVSLNLGDTQKEKIAKDKALKIEKIEYALATLSEYGQTDNIIFKDKLKTRELYIKDLENYCSNNRLDFRSFYKQEQVQEKVAV